MSVYGFMTPEEQARQYAVLQAEKAQGIQPSYSVPNSYNNMPTECTQRRILKREVYDAISLQVFNTTGIRVLNVIKLDEYKNAIKHCCLKRGISLLHINYFSFFDGSMTIQVPYFFCNTCCTLYVYSKFNE